MRCREQSIAIAAALALAASAGAQAPPDTLPQRVRRIVLHVLGGPSYDQPEMRFQFRDPAETLRRWHYKRFGTHWIVWTDGTLWPRRPLSGQPPSRLPVVDRPADAPARALLAGEALPVLGHTRGFNDDSLGIELAHSGRSSDPFPDVQVRSLAWLVGTLVEMSAGRVTPAAIYGHKDLDRRPAYTGCERPGCPTFVDGQGVPFKRRVDPPEALFRQLAEHGVVVPRPAADLDADLKRAEAMTEGQQPARAASSRRSHNTRRRAPH
jgi:hypothetical protein